MGAWTEESAADKTVVERLSGKAYGEWIGRIREIAHQPATPLIRQDGKWKFVSRFEGWYALGPRFFDDHLDQLKATAVSVLRERDPQFELSPKERYMASIHGKVLTHSHTLRSGLAESLALMGSHPQALRSCSLGKAEATAVLATREILGDADWIQWASLDDLLPLLAEAAPGEFLDAVVRALQKDPCPFDEIFAQEGDGISGRNHMTGLLWALETLAWDADNLSRVTICLGELAARDAGGRWANRPANSLTMILLPWLPQTCAPIAKRVVAVKTLLAELPAIGWKVLTSLLPHHHSVSFGSRRPAWRATIPDDWQHGVTKHERRDQEAAYAELAVGEAQKDVKKLSELIEHLPRLSDAAHEKLLEYLGSDTVLAMSPIDRLQLWNSLLDLVDKHRKFADAEWAMGAKQVERIASITDRLAPDTPFLRHQRLFSERDFDLFEEKGNYAEQTRKLETRRQTAVMEVADSGGIKAVISFAGVVQSPWRVGIAFGATASSDVDVNILPDLFDSDQKPLTQFAGGFVWGRFRSRDWSWVDSIKTADWTSGQIGQFLSYLPFTQETWERAKHLLGEKEDAYWSKVTANPYEAKSGLEQAVDCLIHHGRPYAALRCLHKILNDEKPLDNSRVFRALIAALNSSEDHLSMDAHEIVDLIKALQDDPRTNPDNLFRVEWAYLRLLDEHRGASPKLLWRRLADNPKFFCDVIQLVFKSKKEEYKVEEPSEEKKGIVTNAYHLLSEWRTPPGLRADGIYDGDTMLVWLDAVKKECAETGHLEIAMTMLGHALIYAPPDPDGLWIHRSVAAVLNAKDAEVMRDGFQTELFNSRGVHWVDPTGQPEKELATKYRERAETVENAEFHRLATTLRELADTYEREAVRVSSRRRTDD